LLSREFQFGAKLKHPAIREEHLANDLADASPASHLDDGLHEGGAESEPLAVAANAYGIFSTLIVGIGSVAHDPHGVALRVERDQDRRAARRCDISFMGAKKRSLWSSGVIWR
jgi:hypothetical protein